MIRKMITGLGAVLVLLMLGTLAGGSPVAPGAVLVGPGGGFQAQTGTPRPASSPTVTPTFEPGGGELSIGDVGEGFINFPDQVDSWTFPGNAGEIVAINLSATGVDLVLSLIGPVGNQLLVANNSVYGFDARINNYVLPQTGFYGIQVSARGGRTGSYALSLMPASPTFAPPTPGPSPTPFDRPIDLAEAASAQILPDSPGDRFVVEVEQPVVVEVLLEAADRYSTLYLDLVTPDDSIQTLIDYRNESPAVLLPFVSLSMPGEYVFRVVNPRNYPVDYTFTLAENASASVPQGRLVYGRGVSGELLFPGQEDRWVFEGRRGDIVDIIMNGIRPLDSYLTLYNADGEDLMRSDNVGRRPLDARMTFTLPADGAYTIRASSKNAASVGQYRLQLYLVGEQ